MWTVHESLCLADRSVLTHFDPLDEPGLGPDDADWEVFIADDDEWEPQPEPGDFWVEPDWTEAFDDSNSTVRLCSV